MILETRCVYAIIPVRGVSRKRIGFLFLMNYMEAYMNSALEMAKRLLVDSIWKSANLEGLGTTFPNTEAILNNIPVSTSYNEVNFIINMRNAWQFIFDSIDYPIDVMYLRELNRIAGDRLFNGNGIIRSTVVGIGGTDWTPEIPNYDDIVKDLKTILSIDDSITRALKCFCYIARTQIFIDGNKRVAQLIANKILIEDGVGIFQVPISGISKFIELLVGYYETGIDVKILKFMKNFCIQKVGELRLRYLDGESFDCTELNGILSVLRHHIHYLYGTTACWVYDDNGVAVLKFYNKTYRVDIEKPSVGCKEEYLLDKLVDILTEAEYSIDRIEFISSESGCNTGIRKGNDICIMGY